MRTGTIPNHLSWTVAVLAAAVLIISAGASSAEAQTAEGQPQDLAFEITNATTGGTRDRGSDGHRVHYRPPERSGGF